MVHQKAAKPATAPHGEPASVIEQLGGQLDTTHTTTPIVSQADNALTPSLADLASRIRAEHEATAAIVVASLAWMVAR
jgi:hypothetical protein